MSTYDPYSRPALRSNLAAFLVGRASSAALTFAAFALAARTMAIAEYGSYVALLAILELALAVATGGLDWVATRAIPEYRLHAGGQRIVRAVLLLGGLQSGLIFAAGGIVLVGTPWFVVALRMPVAADLAMLTGALVVVEGIGRLCRDQMLSVLMCQRFGQFAQIVRAGTLASAFGIAWYRGDAVTTSAAVHFELLAAALAACVGACLLAIELLRLRHVPVPSGTWAPPSRRAMWRLALHSYQSYLMVLAYGPQTLTMLITRVLGVEAAAVFGFARGFADQVRRYLPTDLFQGLLRPALVAFHSRSGNVDGLMMRLALWFKSSLVVLFPVVLFFATFGPAGTALLGGAKYAAAWPLVVGLLLGAGTMACRRVVELACNMVHASEVCVRASAWLLAVPPVALALLWATHSVLVVVGLIVVSEAAFCVLAMRALAGRGISLREFDVRGAGRLGVALLCCVILLSIAQGMIALPWPVGAAIVILSWPVALRAAQVFEADELALVASTVPSVARWMPRKGT